MTQPPFSGNDFFDQIDSVARNLTGNAFRLKKNDPTAPQKFTEFVAKGQQEFNAFQPQQPRPQAAQPQSFTDFEQAGFQQPTELDMVNAAAEARIADPQEMVPSFQFGQQQETSPLTSAWNPMPTGIGKDFLPYVELFDPIGMIGGFAGKHIAKELGGGPKTQLAAELLGGIGATDPTDIARIAKGGYKLTKYAADAALKAADEAAAAVGRTGVPNVLDPVPPQTVAGRAAGGAGVQRGFKVTDEAAGKAGAKDTNGNLLNEDVRFTVSNDGSTARAMVLLPDENGKVIGSIVDFETSPELRRQGFGEALVVDTMEELRRRGATSFEVYAEPVAWNKVTKRNEQGFSPKLFSKLGFELTGRKNRFGDREMVLGLIKGPEEVVLPEGFNLQAEMAKANQRGLDDIIKNEPEVAREIGLLDPPTTPATGTAAARGVVPERALPTHADVLDSFSDPSEFKQFVRSGEITKPGIYEAGGAVYRLTENGDITRLQDVVSNYSSKTKEFTFERINQEPIPSEIAPLLEGTKVVDSTGKPLRVFHGTASDFDEFVPSKPKDVGGQTEGIYFEPTKKGADLWTRQGGVGRSSTGAPRIIESYVNLKKPIEANQSRLSSREELIEQGYDGKISRDSDGQITEVVAFDNSQIHQVSTPATGTTAARGAGDAAPLRLVDEPYYLGVDIDPVVVTPRVGSDTRFLEVAEAQRGRAERLGTSGMSAAGGSGVRQYLTEAIGDVINRMAGDMPDSYSATAEKVLRGTREMSRPRFRQELEDQLRSNYDFKVSRDEFTGTYDEFKNRALDMQEAYAEAHAALPVVNQAHRDAQAAAVAFGEQRYADSLAALRRIESHLGSQEAFDAYRLEGAQPATGTAAAARAAGDVPSETLRSRIASQPQELIDTFVINTDETRRVFETPIQQLPDEDLRLAAIYAQSSQFSDSPGIARIGNILNTNVEREVARRGLTLEGSGANTVLRGAAEAPQQVARQVIPQQQAIIDDVGTGALPAGDVAVDAARLTPEQQLEADVAALRGGGGGGAAPPDVHVAPLPEGTVPDLTDFGEQLGITFREGKFGFKIPISGKDITLPKFTPRKVGEFLRLGKADPSLKAQRIGQRLGHILNPLNDEGKNLADRAFSYIDEIGTREGLFGRLNDRGQFETSKAGPLQGLSLNDAELPEILRKLNPEQREFVDRLRQLSKAALDLRNRAGAAISELSESEKLLFLSRGVVARRNKAGEIIALKPSPEVRPGGRGLGGKVSMEKGRVVETMEEVREQGYDVVPYDQRVRDQIRSR